VGEERIWFNFIWRQESIWAYLPVGPLERQLGREFRGEDLRRGLCKTFEKEWIPFFGG
jgi:hypothetical protein